MAMVRSSKTVAGRLVRMIMSRASGVGVSAEEFRRRTGITPEELDDPRARIGRARYECVLELNAEIPPGLDPGRGLGAVDQEFPLLAAAWRNAPTARAAIQAYLRYRPILGESDFVSFRQVGPRARLEYSAEGLPTHAAAQALANFGIVLDLVRSFDQGAPTRFALGLVGPRRDLDVEGHEALLLGPVRFEEPVSWLECDGAGLDVPSAVRNPTLDRALLGELDRELGALARDASLSVTVERSLRQMLCARPREACTERALERICEMLRLTRWTLRRRLAQEGQSFQSIQATVKLEEGRRLLDDSALTLGEVSDRLGFGSPSSFSRFFREMEGVSPIHYRQRCRRAG